MSAAARDEAFHDGWTARDAEVERLTAQLKSAQAENERLSGVVAWNIGRCDAWCRRAETAESTIERAHHESIAGEGRSSVVLAVVRDILSRADLSALAERDKPVAAKTWGEGQSANPSTTPEDFDALMEAKVKAWDECLDAIEKHDPQTHSGIRATREETK